MAKNTFIPRDNSNDTTDVETAAALLPTIYRTDANKKFLHSTISQLTRAGTVKKVSAYIGRPNSKATSSDDIFVTAPTRNRQNYQLEPGFVINDLLGNTVFFKDYQDYIHQLRVFGANVDNHSKLSKQEFYSWNPHINWDMLVNFQNYYWMPHGPDTVTIQNSATAETVSTYTVTVDTTDSENSYMFSPDGLTRNPVITLYRGQTYKFVIDSVGNPFSIKTLRIRGMSNRYNTPLLINNAIDSGTIIFTVPDTAPNELVYVSETNVDMGGIFNILDLGDLSYIDVESEIIGKKTYQFNSVLLSNGMKVQFSGNVFPEQYASGRYYVEGVGDRIQLISEAELEIITTYTTSKTMLFDDSLFDTTPFSDATSYSSNPDYIVINRGSSDKNFWTRNNKWIHKDIIEKSAMINGVIATYDQQMRAVRPIIEFEKNLKLFNFGTDAITDVTMIDDFTIDAFSIIEGSRGYNIDGIDLIDGQRVIFTADTDALVTNNIYRVEFIDVTHISNAVGAIISRQIRLVLDATPVYNQVVLVHQGVQSQGRMYWFNGTSWQQCQHKSASNQIPLFDIVNTDGVSFGNKIEYPGTTFGGTSIFSYKIGTGTNDLTLGFPLSYKNINNIGDIVFTFSLISDTFNYAVSGKTIVTPINTGFLVKHNYAKSQEFTNGWITSNVDATQAAIRLYRNSHIINNFNIDIFDTLVELKETEIRVYVNNKRVPYVDNTGHEVYKWTIVSSTTDDNETVSPLPYHQIVFINTTTGNPDHTIIRVTDAVMIKAFSETPINSNGYYEIPINLQNNPLNGALTDFTLGEVNDHVGSIVDNVYNNGFIGVYPGISNLRDLGNVSQYGTKFVQHSCPASLSFYHITSANNNLIAAIDASRDDYCKFKRTFMQVADSIGIDTDPMRQVNLILQELNRDIPATSPYYFSDMAPCGASVQTDFTVANSENTIFSLSAVFSLDKLSNTAVLVYLNNEQLLHSKDYTFNSQGFVLVTATLATGDIISICEYTSTDGCLIPETPTKLGLWPKYEPCKFLDTTLTTPRMMLQGHDGSLVLAYEDFRDDLILELEKRIYNNIKIQYDTSLFDIADVLPSYIRTNGYTRDEINTVMLTDFYSWSTFIGADFSTILNYDKTNPLTYDYSKFLALDGSRVPGYWRGIYRWMLDTDRPHICPWEMLGISEEPNWWTSVYGPAPYTSNNLIMWKDISNGLVKEPNKPMVRLSKYVRPFLMNSIPVDEDGNLSSPLTNNLVNGSVEIRSQGEFTFGDGSPIEAAWIRNSYYAFSVIKTAILLFPSKTIGVLFDRSRIVRNLAGQLIYADTGVRIKPSDIKLPSVYLSNNRVQTAGLVNYLINNISSDSLTVYNEYKTDLETISANLCHRVSAFTSKEKFKLLLDSKSPTSVGSIFIPQEDYKVVLNTSSPISILTYSGIIITKVLDGYEINGYSRLQPFFKYFKSSITGYNVNVAGISEAYTEWQQVQRYYVGSVVKNESYFYRVTREHTSTLKFDESQFIKLTTLPIVGGITAEFKNKWDSAVYLMPYNTKLTTFQEVVDFILGYGHWLKTQGFVFDEFNGDLGVVANWATSAKEFMFWATQNWSAPTTNWYDWVQGMTVSYGDIIRYNGDYYKALRTLTSNVFHTSDFYLLDYIDLSGNSVISLSPSANKLVFNTVLSVVDDIRNPHHVYEILDASGNPIVTDFLNTFRVDNTVSYQPTSEVGIYCASFYLLQKEHVVIINNETMFNDTIYNPESGYKQDKIKVSGYISTEWNGSLNVPGFIVDQITIRNWTSWTDYVIGDIVTRNSFYYSANVSIQGEESFTESNWIKLDKKPVSKLLPNWSYKATQFTDFYSLDSENFDTAQQRMAQHLTGYQKRQYLENIIQDDVSEYKFYQGIIIEKGTQNVLNKLFDVLSASDKESLRFYEEWAVRTGQYGACSSFENIEFELDESLFKMNPQGFELVKTKTDTNSLIIQYAPHDIYVKPNGYKTNVWPVANTEKTSTVYVRLDEVTLTISDLITFMTADNSTLQYNDYILCSFAPVEWNVYQYVKRSVVISKIDTEYNSESDTSIITLTVNTPLDITVNSYIGIKNSKDDRFFKVTAVTATSIVVTALQTTSIALSLTTSVSLLIPRRATQTIDNNNYKFDDIVTGSLLWTDNDIVDNDFYNDTSNWKVWEYKPVYSLIEKPNKITSITQYGRAVSTTGDGNTIAISYLATRQGVPQGEISIYTKTDAEWIPTQIIVELFNGQTTVTINNTSAIATVIAMSFDGSWLAVGSPAADSNKSGVVMLYKRYENNSYIIYDTLVGVSPGDQYGTTLTFGNNTLFIGTVVGKLYHVNYQSITHASPFYRSLGSNGTTLNVSPWTTGIKPGMHIAGIGFTTGQLVSAVIPYQIAGVSTGVVDTFANIVQKVGGTTSGTNAVFTIIKSSTDLNYDDITVIETSPGMDYALGDTILIDGALLGGVSVVNDLTLTILNTVITTSPPDDTIIPAGRLYFSSDEWVVNLTPIMSLTLSTKFGAAVAVSSDNTLVVSQPYSTDLNGLPILGSGKVFVYRNGIFSPPQTILAPELSPVFGKRISISNNSDYIAVSSLIDSTLQQGSVLVYALGQYSVPYQTITTPKANSTGEFGSYIAFMNNYNSLIIGSLVQPVTFNTTITGVEFTSFVNSTTSSAVDVFDMYNNKWIFGERLSTPLITLPDKKYGASIAVTKTSVIVSDPTAAVTVTVNNVNVSLLNSGAVYEYNKMPNAFSWSVKNTATLKPDISKIKQAFLYNKRTNKLIKYLDIIDPVQNKHASIAEREVKYKSVYDPAVYSVGTSKVNVDAGISWGAAQVGSLWWDLSNAKFYDNHTDSVIYRNSMLSMLVTGSLIDIYEWVETDLLPLEWDAEADTETGLAADISGKTLYGDDAYAEVVQYDTLSRSNYSTYYYWVKNKTTVSSALGRTLSAYEVSSLISNPKGAGYAYLALTGLNSFSLVNVKSDLIHSDVVLSIEYWVTDKTDQNIHSQWKLLSESPNTALPAVIEQKWFDSLCGRDLQNRMVPDQVLPIKLKYGIENRPRQGMFINRFEALKQFFEQLNLCLKDQLVVDTKNLNNLMKYDEPPLPVKKLYDTVLDTDSELRFAITKYFTAPQLSAVVTDGTVTGVVILNSGKGYLVAPYITVYGAGTGAIITAIINKQGHIIGADIVNGGSGYNDSTVLSVRHFSALITSDVQSSGKWAIYSYDPSSNSWSKTLSHTYNTQDFWEHIDWYAPNYNQFTSVQYLINTYSELPHIEPKIGDRVKIQTTSAGRWVLLEKYKNSTSNDWTSSYKVIGSQNGTIQFNSLLYNFKDTSYGFDGTIFDNNEYDNFAGIELRIILNAIKDDLLITDLKTEYIKLFFTTVRYALSEQTYIDWIFKTSLVSVMHNVGYLHQSSTYKNDNLSNFEDYVSEVKPYRTQIREYISTYNKIDATELVVTDFDLPAAYDPDRKLINPVDEFDPLIQEYPWKHWLDNVGYKIIDIKIVNAGSKYVTEPTVIIESSTGSGATAKAYIVNETLARITVLTPGSGYTTSPKVVITGGYTSSGTPASAIAIIGEGVIRTNTTKLKFDRIDQTYVIDELEFAETLTNVSGTRVQFPLSWVPDITIGKTTVTINGVLAIRDNYAVGTTSVLVNNHASNRGVITFKTPPTKNSEIVVSYSKDVTILGATDRIQYYYEPQVGDLGKDLSQLMDGIDYGGVVVTGLNFDVVHGWDNNLYSADTWDNFDPTLNDYSITVGTKFLYDIQLPYTPEQGMKLNVYYKKVGVDIVRIDAEDFQVGVINDNVNVVMATIISTGDTSIVQLPSSINAGNGDTFIIRKETSDGSATNTYDVQLDGGSIVRGAMGSVVGVLPEDIVIDGDDFHSTTTGYGPEEMVPGQVVDTLGIKIYNNTSTGAFMQFKNMLNSVQYSRLNANKKTTLANDLHVTDTTISVVNSSSFDATQMLINRSGVIDINGERIEFFTNVNNELGLLRRGTMGTGVPAIHKAGTVVQEISRTETIRYTDDVQIDQFTSNDSQFINLAYSLTKVSTTWSYRSDIPADYGQTNEIEVFVGGYAHKTEWQPDRSYLATDIVSIGSYIYRCAVDHTSSSNFGTDRTRKIDNQLIWNFFIGNTRLKKEPYLMFNVNLNKEVWFDADFSVNGKTKQLRLTNILDNPDTIVTVVRKRGSYWALALPQVLTFINAEPGATYEAPVN